MDTHREKALSNKTPTPTKNESIDTWVVGTLNRLSLYMRLLN